MLGFNQFLREIQNSDVDTKRRWLYGLTGVSMLLIVGFWIGYMNITVPTIAQPSERILEFARLQPKEEPRATDVLVAGLSTIVRAAGLEISKAVLYLRNTVFGAGKTITVTPQDNPLLAP